MLSNDIKVVQYNEKYHYSDLTNFCCQAELDGLENNSSIDKLKLRNNYALFLIYYHNKIISMSYVQNLNEYYPDTWRCFTRTATLKEYRSKFIPFNRNLISAAGINSYSLIHQVEYAQTHGAKQIIFTTNSNGNGYSGSNKMNSFLFKIVKDDPRFSFLEEKEIYYTKQSVWRLNYKDIFNLKDPI